MKNINRLHIKNHCCVRLNTIANNYGLTTIGQLRTMLDRMKPSSRIAIPLSGHMRVASVKKLLDNDINDIVQ